MALYDRVWFTTATTGTGTITVGSAVSGYQTPATASIPNAGTFPYTILDGVDWEIGTGTYTSAGTTVARVLVSSSTGSLISLSGTATMFVTMRAGTTPQTNLANVFTSRQDVSSTLRASGVSNFSAGVGLEMYYTSGTGVVLAYDRGGSAYMPVQMQGSTVSLSAVTGDITLTPTSGNIANVGPVTMSTTLAVTGTATMAAINASGAFAGSSSIKSTSATLGIGYATGAGGAVTQGTNRTTGVTLDKICGAITLISAAGSTTIQSFTVTNSTVAATDTVNVVQKSGTDLYRIYVTNVAAGSFKISYATLSGTTTEQPVFNFSVIKAVTS